MSRGRNYSVYLDANTIKRFEKVMAHLNKGVSGTFVMLIDLKSSEIDEGTTRRQTMKDVQEGLVRMEDKIDRMLNVLEPGK